MTQEQEKYICIWEFENFPSDGPHLFAYLFRREEWSMGEASIDEDQTHKPGWVHIIPRLMPILPAINTEYHWHQLASGPWNLLGCIQLALANYLHSHSYCQGHFTPYLTEEKRRMQREKKILIIFFFFKSWFLFFFYLILSSGCYTWNPTWIPTNYPYQWFL